jgi:proteic killer suppression protein
VIKSYRGEWARQIFEGRRAPKGMPHAIAHVARRKLVQIADATDLRDLTSPPGNRLEALKHDLAGKHSIRINDQWRIVFRWTKDGAEEVEICDYH